MSPRVPFQTLEWPRRLVAGAFVVCGLWYLSWRPGTLNPEAWLFSSLVYAAEVFGFGAALLHVFMCWRLTVRRAPLPRPGIGVDVFVPSYNESVDLVRKTLLAARAMDYPHVTWLLDDGRRDEMRRLAEELGVNYLTRADNAHAKAGNLNHALGHSAGELVVVFDADHAPRRDFLLRTLGYFEDPKVAFVQTPQDFYNLDSYQHRRGRGRGGRVWTEQALFFRVIQRGKDYWNSAFFCGSCAVVRRSALQGIGGFATGTVTEDLHTSIRLHARGHKSVYHAEPLAFGLAPESVEPFLGQRIRWGQGAMHVWRMEGLLTHRGLSWAQRLNYFASVLTYFDGWQKAVFYFAPVVVLLSGTMPLVADTPSFLLHFLPYYLLTFWCFEEVGRGYGRTLFIEQYNMARFAAFAWATLAWVLPRRWLRFKVTPKGMLADGSARVMLPQSAVLLLNAAAIPLGALVYLRWRELPLDGLVANVLWASANAAMALAVLGFTRRTTSFTRTAYRFPVPLPASLGIEGGPLRAGTADDISDQGLRYYGPYDFEPPPGTPVRGRIELPDGPLAFHGEVRGIVARDAKSGDGRALGCSIETSAADRLRLESFLYGSDLQWTLNGLSDQARTPLSKALPGIVAGPPDDLLAGARWNGATLEDARRGQPWPVLVSPAPGAADAWLVLAFQELPVGRDLLLDVARRQREAPRLMRLHARAAATGPASVRIYKAAPAPTGAARLPSAVLDAREALAVLGLPTAPELQAAAPGRLAVRRATGPAAEAPGGGQTPGAPTRRDYAETSW